MRLTTKIFIGAVFTILTAVTVVIFVLAYLERTKDESMYIHGKRIEYVDIEGIDSLVFETSNKKKWQMNNSINIESYQNNKTLRLAERAYKSIVSQKRQGTTLIITLNDDNATREINQHDVIYLTLPDHSSFSITSNKRPTVANIRDAKLKKFNLNLTDGMFYVNNSQLDTLNVVRNVNNRNPKETHEHLFWGNVSISYFKYTGNDIVDGQLEPYSTIEAKNITPESTESLIISMNDDMK